MMANVSMAEKKMDIFSSIYMSHNKRREIQVINAMMAAVSMAEKKMDIFCNIFML